MQVQVKELNKELISRANSISMMGTRGDSSEASYKADAARILSWPISDEKKQKLVDKLYEKCSEKLRHEAQHVSPIVAGPSGYSSRMDHSDRILRLGAEISEWMSDLERQVKESSIEYRKADREIDMIEWCAEQGYDPKDHLAVLATLDVNRFMELYDELYPKYRWRKNCTVVKLYEKAKAGELKQPKKEIIFESADYKAYIEGDRVFIKFTLKPKRQLMVALRSRGYWWNNQVDAYSTYLRKLDREWIENIGVRYAAYI